MRRSKGFTMLELLVAVAIMGVSLGMLYQATGSSVRHIGNIERQQRAAVLAESVLALHDVVPAVGWQERGESAGFSWHVASVPFSSSAVGLNATPLHEVTVEISWSDAGTRRELALRTLKPERKPLPGETVR